MCTGALAEAIVSIFIVIRLTCWRFTCTFYKKQHHFIAVWCSGAYPRHSPRPLLTTPLLASGMFPMNHRLQCPKKSVIHFADVIFVKGSNGISNYSFLLDCMWTGGCRGYWIISVRVGTCPTLCAMRLQPCHVWHKPISEGRHKVAPCREALSFIYCCGIHPKFYCSHVLSSLISAFLMATLELYSQSTGALSKLSKWSIFKNIKKKAPQLPQIIVMDAGGDD